MSHIGSKLNVLAYQLDTNSIWWNLYNETASDYAAESSEQKSYVVPAQAPSPPGPPGQPGPPGAPGPAQGWPQPGAKPRAPASASDTVADSSANIARTNRQNRQNWVKPTQPFFFLSFFTLACVCVCVLLFKHFPLVSYFRILKSLN